ncbi:phosphoribosylamine--glycine ligase [Bacillus sp. FJAT-49736]|uniref:phosphoribosylamine--glycine ligase n=1 Tax=Bacillus sp. FJAT-49736 TaxID=2833582 RepID=UPI001BCA2694|nr:phosphoribosylamine--glycine ligase [Bacillus sp. FJAT-49736]MBS4175645.1 phosphoribosylamine--glycine ligase [Bacillus sp. FJAT-49736]
MKVLVIGRGGREHAICKKVKESNLVSKVYCAPGNGGISEDAELVPISEDQFSDLIAFVKENQIDLTIVGPEDPLTGGIVNEFQDAGLKIFGPRKEAAIIEGSKVFAKELMQKYKIPTADYQAFQEFDKAKEYVEKKGAPIVIKADGLAAGKGVVVAMTVEEAIDALKEMMLDEKFGKASSSVVMEEFLQGEEFSLMAFVNGLEVHPMVIAQDHKRAFDGDKGPNTGGMGAYSPVPHIPEKEVKRAIREILQPTVLAMFGENRSFCGVLYAGLILTNEGPKVIEFNARFGDPETQVILARLKSDFVQLVLDLLDEREPEIVWDNSSVIGVVLASNGYPEQYKKGIELPNLDMLSMGTSIFHAGTEKKADQFVSNGGRVLVVQSKGNSLEEAIEKVYEEMDKISSNDFFYRKDIGRKAIF